MAKLERRRESALEAGLAEGWHEQIGRAGPEVLFSLGNGEHRVEGNLVVRLLVQDHAVGFQGLVVRLELRRQDAGDFVPHRQALVDRFGRSRFQAQVVEQLRPHLLGAIQAVELANRVTVAREGDQGVTERLDGALRFAELRLEQTSSFPLQRETQIVVGVRRVDAQEVEIHQATGFTPPLVDRDETIEHTRVVIVDLQRLLVGRHRAGFVREREQAQLAQLEQRGNLLRLGSRRLALRLQAALEQRPVGQQSGQATHGPEGPLVAGVDLEQLGHAIQRGPRIVQPFVEQLDQAAQDLRPREKVRTFPQDCGVEVPELLPAGSHEHQALDVGTARVVVRHQPQAFREYAQRALGVLALQLPELGRLPQDGELLVCILGNVKAVFVQADDLAPVTLRFVDRPQDLDHARPERLLTAQCLDASEGIFVLRQVAHDLLELVESRFGLPKAVGVERSQRQAITRCVGWRQTFGPTRVQLAQLFVATSRSIEDRERVLRNHVLFVDVENALGGLDGALGILQVLLGELGNDVKQARLLFGLVAMIEGHAMEVDALLWLSAANEQPIDQLEQSRILEIVSLGTAQERERASILALCRENLACTPGQARAFLAVAGVGRDGRFQELCEAKRIAAHLRQALHLLERIAIRRIQSQEPRRDLECGAVVLALFFVNFGNADQKVTLLSRILRARQAQLERPEHARIVGLEHVDRLEQRSDACARRRLYRLVEARFEIADRASVLPFERERLLELVERALRVPLLLPQDA